MYIKRASISPVIERIISTWPISKAFGLASAYIAYPIAERIEGRSIYPKLRELQNFYQLSADERGQITRNQLCRIVEFSVNKVPYYRDLFRKHKIDTAKLARDEAYMGDIPFLTKDIIREQGERLLSTPLNKTRHHLCKTGGSTGLSCHIFYDQEAADYSAATTLYARGRVGKKKTKSELHFACRFPDSPILTEWFTKEDFKCFAMNRTNIFFDRLDSLGLEEIWTILRRRNPFLVHAHPSTIYALACHIRENYGVGRAFSIFESSGELLEAHQRNVISEVLQCAVIDRYGLAELGVMAYQLNGSNSPMQILESEGLGESVLFDDCDSGHRELVFTGFRNKLMPLIRYRTGDLGNLLKNSEGIYLTDVVGRIHDQVPINGINHATHHIQDILDHKVGGIQEFQIDLRSTPPKLRIVPEGPEQVPAISDRVKQYWGSGFELEFIGHQDLVRVGRHAKFRHVVHP
ncbi:phenylacetate--CoA ligase family protein [Polynucleobacter paneuropaeus]|nr:phenylacetate--CoA ligase family protein [Polynucleobacter paneuropaeus]